MQTAETAPGLASELAAAEAAAAPLRQRADELAASLDTAIRAADFARAAALQDELPAVREAAAVADARVAAVLGARAAVDREREASGRKLAEAQAADQAGKDLVRAQADVAASTARMNASITAMRESFAAARRHLNAAKAAETDITAARARELDARHRLGHFPPGHPGPAPARANAATVLEAGGDPLVAALVRAYPG